MTAKTAVEMERYKLGLRVRAEASCVRAEYLNQILPAALEEFDRRVLEGLPVTMEIPSAARMIEAAAEQLNADAAV